MLLFHIISRAIEERKIFQKTDDCFRFIFQAYAANLGKPALNLYRRDIIKTSKAILSGEQIPTKMITVEHKPLVSFLDFSLVVNHYHFYLAVKTKENLSAFMQKLNGGFAMFYNLKYQRQGSLFGRRYKAVPVENDSQSQAVSRYISIINSLDNYQPGWRESGLKDFQKAFDFLKKFQFSSFPDRIGVRNSGILAEEKELEKYGLGVYGKNDYYKFVKEFLKGRLSISGLE